MRISIVPAQITTVEDKLAGNISVQQATWLGIPILFGLIISLIFPPIGQFVTYKLIIVIVLLIVCGAMAIRIRDQIIAKWVVLFIAYCARPKYYVYDKNSLYMRDHKTDTANESEVIATPAIKKPKAKISAIAPREFARLENFALDAKAGMKFEVGKKGKLNVRITEVK